MSIKRKLHLSFGVVIVLFMIALIISLLLSMRINDLTRETININNKMNVIEQVNSFAKTANADFAYYLLAPSNLQSDYQDRYTLNVEQVNLQVNELENLAAGTKEQEEIEQFKEEWQQYIANNEILISMHASGDVVEAQEAFTKKSFDPVAFSLLSYTKNQEELVKEKEQTILETTSIIRIVNVIIPIIVITISIVLATILARRITNSVRTLQHNVVEVSKGNLTIDPIQVTSKDEIGVLGKAFNEMVTSLRSLISGADEVSGLVASASAELQASSEETSNASEHISGVIQEISSGNNMQLSRVEENLETIHGLKAKVNNISKSSASMVSMVETSTETAEHGKKDLNNAIDQVQIIEQSTDNMESAINQLKDQSHRIQEVINVISSIADQTNLLALNAAIEATRAGEAGKGFAVVADEIRKLAEQSQGSTNEISDIISTIQQEIDTTVAEMQNGKVEVSKGIELINVTGDSFHTLLQSIKQVETEATTIGNLTTEIETDTSSVTTGIENVSEIASANAEGTESVSAAAEEQMASMEEVAASSESLAKQAEELKILIGKFRY